MEPYINAFIEILRFGLPSVLLPLLIIRWNNQHNIKLKELEQKLEVEKLSTSKSIEKTFVVDNEKRIHEKDVYACLLKTLFEIQKLHIELSGNCVDFKCIDSAVMKFKASLTKYQEIIADNQIYLSAEATNYLYGFYQLTGELLIELKEIQDKKKYHLANACVYLKSQFLAMKTLQVRHGFNQDSQEQIDEELFEKEYSNFISCCGNAPGSSLMEEYFDFSSEFKTGGKQEIEEEEGTVTAERTIPEK